MLDLIVGELVRLRNGEIAKVKKVDKTHISISVLALNGFGGTLWEEYPYQVLSSTGKYSNTPHGRDIKSKVKRKSGFWSDKFIDVPLEKY